MSAISASIRKYQLAWFYGISVLIVVLIIPLFIITDAGAAIDQAFLLTGAPFNTDLVTWTRLVIAYPAAWLGALLALLQVASPDIAVAIVVGIGFGRRALHDLKRRFRFWPRWMSWRRGLRVWIACVAVFIAMSVATAGLSQFVLPVPGFTWTIEPWSLPLVTGLLVAMFLDGGALFEENGWRGFALPRLLQRFSPLSASIILGLLWSFWHVPVKFDLALSYGLANFVIMFAVLTLKFTLLTIIMTYFWNRAGQATIIAIAMHGLSNDSVRLGGNVVSEAFGAQLQYELNLVLPMLVVAGVLIIATHGQLGLAAASPGLTSSPRRLHVHPFSAPGYPPVGRNSRAGGGG